MKKILLPLLLTVLTVAAQAQNSGRFTIKGTVVDSAGAALPGATVMLLAPKDSALVNYNRSDEEGKLEFKNVKRATYILKISYVGYIPEDMAIEPKENDVVDVGNIKLKVLNQDLYEVVTKYMTKKVG